MSVGLFGGGGMKVTGSDRLEFAMLLRSMEVRYVHSAFWPAIRIVFKTKGYSESFYPMEGIL